MDAASPLLSSEKPVENRDFSGQNPVSGLTFPADAVY
jgi:hypothetical protein